jgi:hypothetical protein
MKNQLIIKKLLLVFSTIFLLTSAELPHHVCVHDKMNADVVHFAAEEIIGPRNLQSTIPAPIRITFDYSSLDTKLSVD